MKIQFDANQNFQLDAIAAVAEIFDGQPQGAPEFSVIKVAEDTELFAGQERSELGIGNRLLLDDAKLRESTRLIQSRNDIEVVDEAAALEGWEVFDAASNVARTCPHFSVEMETGTGKTYVYLRTVFELSRRYGFKKFIIVVPSVAIREGVLKNIEITAEHFRALYDNMPFEHFVYDAKRVNRLRQFATLCKFSSSISTRFVRISPAQRPSRRATSSTKRATGSPGDSLLSLFKRRGPSLSLMSRSRWTAQTRRRKPLRC
jgi:type III restriction enzyme